MVPTKIYWDPFNQIDPGPCIKVIIANTDETIEAGRAIGLEYPPPLEITALIDTGSPFTIVNRVHAVNRMLAQTGAGTEIRTLGGKAKCGECSGTVSFPGTGLKRIETLRILSRDFEGERHYSCLIGRDVLRHWNITFDGRSKLITITD